MRKFQIGVMGSAADLNYAKELEEVAEKIGELIARSGNILVYGAEKDYDSLSTAAARAAKRAGGLTVGVTYGKGKDVYDEECTDVLISCGLDRGGGREFVLVNSCDAIICISGGSGTLNEIAIAYQSNIPIICLKGIGGWSGELAGIFLDSRKRVQCIGVDTPEEAVASALKLASTAKTEIKCGRGMSKSAVAHKKIGILGGMGPESTAELYLRIIRIFQMEYGARYDSDFPEIMLLSLPIPDVVEGLAEKDGVRNTLVGGVRRLEAAGADFVVVPCNTVACFLPDMQAAVSIPVTTALNETAKAVQDLGLKKVGLLATESTVQKKIYAELLENVTILTPNIDEQKKITHIIMNILSGDKRAEDLAFLNTVIDALRRSGCKKVILGCTDLPLLIKGDADIIDSIEVLARAAVRKAMALEEPK